ncbi:MAG: cytochrome-c peroxidase [Flavobacteriales bacterium]|nr:cytochrome-c peroxidase [Flavobacteriales bacterium]
MKKYCLNILLIVLFTITYSCSKDEEGCTDPLATNYNPDAKKDNGYCSYPPKKLPTIGQPTPAPIQIPQFFSQNILPPIIPVNNPQTVEGIALGRKLFFDKILSSDGSVSCASCHSPEFAFTDTSKFSLGVANALGDRHSMPIFNVAWNWDEKFFWDGRANSVETQALGPVVNPREMNNTWINAVASLQNTTTYPPLFNAAFGTTIIDSILVTKAIAQFERTLISANSRFDKFLRSEISLTRQELNGFAIFDDPNRGDCAHCHGSANNPLWTDNKFHNNGLDATFTDLGRAIVTGDPNDNGKFKTPSLRNLAYSAPFMHDGRFATLDEVIDHYSTGVTISPTIDPLMELQANGGSNLTLSEKIDLKAFLLSLSDPDFINNPDFQAP